MASDNGDGRSFAGTIAVFGSSRRDEESALYVEAYELGRLLSRAGYAVLSGGYYGSMGAVSRGAAEAGGHVIGVTCALFDPLPPNRWLAEEVKAADLMERLAIMMRRADGFVAVRGGIGTLSEVTLAWSLLQTRSFRGKPLILLGDDWQPVVSALRQNTDLGSSIAGLARVACTPAEAVAALASEPLPTPPGPPPQG
jgi:uncharacterized protein (TIGR00730 family)